MTLDGERTPYGPATCSSYRRRRRSPSALAATEPLVAYCCFPTDGQAFLPGGEPFTPPWAL